MLLVRHARAGDRSAWAGDDRERPVDERGRRRADELVELLTQWPLEAIYTSPYLRCVETVQPIAAARGLVPELCDELGEERQMTDGIALVRSLAGRDALVCGHGGLEHALVAPPKWRKGAVLIVDDALRVVDEL